MPSPRPAFFSVALTAFVALVALAACADDPDHDGPALDPPTTTVALPLETVGACHVPEELELVETTLWTCAENVDCPCGSRCELGRCTFDCRVDASCASGEVCDPLGRCVGRPPPASDQLPNVARPFTVAPASIMLSAPGTQQALTITAGTSALPLLEVTGDPGVTILCDPTQTTPTCACAAGVCTVVNLAANGQRRLWIGTPAGPRPAAPQWRVYVASDHHRETIDVGLLPAVTTTLPGHYEGLLRFETTGVTGNTFTAALAGRAIPIEADVGPVASNVYPIAVRSPSGLLGTDDRLRGTINCTFGTCVWGFSSGGAVDGVALPGWTQPLSAVTFTGGTLAGAVTLTLDGAGATRGVLTGRAQLTWRGPAQPVPPAPAQPATPAATTLLPWEQVVVDNSDPALGAQTMFNATSLSWGEFACAVYYGGQGYTSAQVDQMCSYRQQWRDAWLQHIAALRDSPATATCEWTSTAPIDYVPCNWDDVQNSTCSTFTPYGCTMRDTAVINGVATTGCRITWTQSTYPIVNKPLQCSQRYVCAPTPPVASTASYDPGTYELFPSTVAAGDLKCAPPSLVAPSIFVYLPQAFGYFTNADRVPPRRGSEMLRACVADLLDEPDANRTIAEMLQHDGCLDLARATRALGFAGEPARLRATGGPAATTGWLRATDAIFLRLVQQWAETHAFVARAGVEEVTVASVLRLEPADALFGVAGDTPPLDALIDVQQRGWATLLHPRVAQALAYADAGTLRAPDYRRKDFDVDRSGEETIVTSLATHQQAVSVPVTLLEAAAAYTELIELDLDRAWRSSDPFVKDAAMARARVAFRQILAAESLAIGAWRRAVASPPVGTAPPWEAQLRIAHRRLAAGLSRTLSMSDAIATGGNPLGMSEEDLPVYFFDPVGSVSQYFAMSGYLLNKAAPAVDAAQSAFLGARTAWDTRRTQAWTQLVQSNGDVRRQADVRERHGRAIQELCGVKGQMAAENVLSTWMDVNTDGVPDVAPEVCHLTTATGCSQTAYTTAALDALATNSIDDRRLSLCLAAEAFRPWRQLPGPITSPQQDLLYRLTGQSAAAAITTITGAPITVNATSITVTAFSTSFAIPRADFYGGNAMVPPEAQARCLEAFRLGKPYPLANRPENPRARAECFQGRLGELDLSVQSQIKAFEESRASFDGHLASYANAIDACLRIDEHNGLAAQARADFNATMSELRRTKLALDIAGTFMSAVSSILLMPVENPAMPLAALFAGASALTSGGSLAVGADMENTRAAHETFMANLQGQLQSDLCYIGAEQHLIGLDAAAIAIDRTWINVQQGVVALQNARDAVTANVRDARAAIDREVATQMPNLPYEHWLEESIEVFLQKQRHARRVTYLAARAAEYETQSSLIVSEQILRADHPNQLDAAWTAIENVAGPQGVPTRPDPDVLTFSLCALLGNEDSGGQGPVVGAACNVDDLRRRLIDPANAVFGPTGTYLGQRIRFALAPFGTAATGDCGERVWSVAAYIRGAAAFQGFVPNVDLELRQRNTFASQRCTGGAMQVASTRPCNNLMLEDPFGPTAGQAMSCGADTFATARVSADRDAGGPTFFDPDPNYPTASGELAGRGVYGDWELFIPQAELWGSSRPVGLVLEEVEDIVIRLGTNSRAPE